MEQLNSKVLLFGEYAVLHNGMALVIPWDKYNGYFDFKTAHEEDTDAIKSNEYLRKFSAFVSSRMDEKFVLEVKRFEQELNDGLFFKSDIPQGYGLGSSGALVAAIVLRYLVKAKHLKDEIKMTTRQKLRELKKNLGNLESFFHGVSSGIDPLSIILNEPVLYSGSQDINTVSLPKQSEKKENVVFLIDTNCPRTTSNMMNLFDSLLAQPNFKTKFDEYVLENNNQAIQHFLNNESEEFYNTMNHLSKFQLDYMKDFFPEKMRSCVSKGLDNGDYFLKLCGAGGGGYILGFTKNWEQTQKQLSNYKLEEIYSY